VAEFVEKPIIPEHWINAGFFVFSRRVFDVWDGHNLEVDVLPRLARRDLLFTYQHNGFWKSMDTSKDQEELEQVFKSGGVAPWAGGHGTARRRLVTRHERTHRRAAGAC
jgi:glucose-1-phosphate cytidylyltransferase